MPPSFVPENIYFENYLALFRNRDFFNYLKNSTIISVFSMIGAIILAAPMAYALARKRVKGLDALLFFIIIIQMVPGNSMALPLYGMFSKWHITNSYFGIIIANITSSLPFIVLVLRTSFLDISQALEDAARIDGCSAWGHIFENYYAINTSGACNLCCIWIYICLGRIYFCTCYVTG